MVDEIYIGIPWELRKVLQFQQNYRSNKFFYRWTRINLVFYCQKVRSYHASIYVRGFKMERNCQFNLVYIIILVLCEALQHQIFIFFRSSATALLQRLQKEGSTNIMNSLMLCVQQLQPEYQILAANLLLHLDTLVSIVLKIMYR
jgi:hypothetical protein